MSRGFPGVLRDQLLEVELRRLVLLVGPSGVAIDGREFGPAIGQAHVYDAHRLEPRPRRFDAEQARGLTALDAAPELLLGRQQQVLVERIAKDCDLDPLSAARDDRENRTA